MLNSVKRGFFGGKKDKYFDEWMGGVEVAIVMFVNINHLCKLGKKVFDTAGG